MERRESSNSKEELEVYLLNFEENIDYPDYIISEEITFHLERHKMLPIAIL